MIHLPTTLEDRLKTGWIIDVCASCGRNATFPFCEHRRIDRSWTVVVAVKPINPAMVRKDAARVRSG
jgi:hypothetical protein